MESGIRPAELHPFSDNSCYTPGGVWAADIDTMPCTTPNNSYGGSTNHNSQLGDLEPFVTSPVQVLGGKGDNTPPFDAETDVPVPRTHFEVARVLSAISTFCERQVQQDSSNVSNQCMC